MSKTDHPTGLEPSRSMSLIESAEAEQGQNEDILKFAHYYELPPAVQLALNADFKQANTTALITALFAVGLLTLAQMVPDDHPSGAGWGALRFFLYSAVILNLSGTFLSFMAIKMCTDLPHHAQQMVVLDEKSWPSLVARGETLSKNLLTDHWLLLKEFGMSSRYKPMDALFVYIVILGGLYTFVAVIIWIWLTESYAVAGATMVTVVPAVASVAYSVIAAGGGQGWR